MKFLGLVIKTAKTERFHDQLLDAALQGQLRLEREKAKAHREKREAQRILAILTEPLKDWDLADFPMIDTSGITSNGMNEDQWCHLAATIQAYRIVATDAAKARMSVVSNDQTRQRGWGDAGLTVEQAGRNILRNLNPRRLP